jgi:hypothetical protein
VQEVPIITAKIGNYNPDFTQDGLIISITKIGILSFWLEQGGEIVSRTGVRECRWSAG